MSYLSDIVVGSTAEATRAIVKRYNTSGDTFSCTLDIGSIFSDFLLVPRTIQPITESGDPLPVSSTNQRLIDLHKHLQDELRAILQETGHLPK